MAVYRFAIIGAGNVAQIHAAALREIEQARITVICNRGDKRGGELASQTDADWVQDYREAVQREDVDVMTICTPSGTHGEIAAAAARSGKHILVEKPLEITLPRIDAMLHAADTAGVQISCIFQSRMRQGVQAAKRALDAGRLGTLIFANAFVPWHRSPEYYAYNWRGSWTLDGGGALMNQSIHSIDLLQWLAGDVASVFASTATRVHDIEAEDTATALVQFNNGAQGVIQGATSLGLGHVARIELHGSAGSIILEDGRVAAWKLGDASPEEEAHIKSLDTWIGSGASNPTDISYVLHQAQIEQFIRALDDPGEPMISGSEGRKAVEIIRAIYSSASQKQVIRLPFDDA